MHSHQTRWLRQKGYLILSFNKLFRCWEVADLDIEKAKKMSYESLRGMYKSYLEGQELSRNTVQTMSGDT